MADTAPDDAAASTRATCGQRLLCAENLPIGVPFDLGIYQVTHDEIVSFARHWDPLPIHVDDKAAAEGQFGEVIASGIHTLAIFQRLAALGPYRDWDVVAGRAIRDVQLTSPVRPGMSLRGSVTVVGIELSHRSRALVTQHGALTDAADGTPILSLVIEAYVRRRRPAQPAAS